MITDDCHKIIYDYLVFYKKKSQKRRLVLQLIIYEALFVCLLVFFKDPILLYFVFCILCRFFEKQKSQRKQTPQKFKFKLQKTITSILFNAAKKKKYVIVSILIGPQFLIVI